MTTQQATAEPATEYLTRPEGNIGYDIQGAGPLVLLTPGMGDLRSAYRFLTPALVASGYTVATTDLRGHGDSDTTFSSYGDVQTAGDISALIEKLGVPAVIIGNSLAAGAAALVAADHPHQVTGLVLVGPYVRNPKLSAPQLAVFRAAMAPLWAATSWKYYLPSLYAGRKPVDFDDYRKSVIANLRRPGYAKAFSLTARQTDHAPVEARLADVVAPVLVIMGDRDPDFTDPAAEARWIGDTLRGGVVMVPEAGHYPQSQQPAIVTSAVLKFLADVTNHA
jgi:pimeloyl-ACP methyl ester carboxylesterase